MNTHLKIYIVVVALMLSRLAIVGQSTLSLSEVIDKGLSNNFDVQITELDKQSAEIRNNWADAGALPSVSISALTRYSDNELNGKSGSVKPAVALDWLLFKGFAVQIRKEKLDYLQQLSGGNARLVVENTIQSIVLSYYKTVVEQQRLTLLKEIMDLSEARYNYTSDGLKIGTGSTYEMLQAKTSWLSDKSQFLAQQVQLQAAMRQLFYLMGEKGLANVVLTDELDVPNNEYLLADLLAQLEVGNANLKNQYLNLAMLDNSIALAKTGYYPSLSFGAGADKTVFVDNLSDAQANGGPFDFYTYYAQFAINWVVFDGMSVKRSIKLAQIEKSIGAINLEDIKLQLQNRMLTLFDQYKVRKELVAIAGENLEAARLNMQMSEEKYKSGVINSFNYRDVQNAYLNTALQQLNASYNLIDTHTELVRLTGGILSQIGK